MLLNKIFFGQFWQKKIKIWFGGSPKQKFVRENPHHAPQMINGRPLRSYNVKSHLKVQKFNSTPE